MLTIICVLIALFASFVGSVSGIGGGIIIKPVLDLTGQLPIETVNFLSGVTVLIMTTASLIQNFLGRKKLSSGNSNSELIKNRTDQQLQRKQSRNCVRNPGSEFSHNSNVPTANVIQQKIVNPKQILFLSLGSVVGGFIGSTIFSTFMKKIGDQGLAVLIQAILILLITIIVMVYQSNKKKIITKRYSGFVSEAGIGLILGVVSSFLGIGGGPLNIAMLAFFFSMSPKIAALSSLTIIFSAQIVSLLTTVIGNRIPTFDPKILISMMVAGVLGALIGRFLAKKLSEEKTDAFFNIALWLILAINVYNVTKHFFVG